MLLKPKKAKNIYFDNASTTVIDQKVLQVMKPLYQSSYANPSSLHKEGKRAQAVLENSRKEIAKYLGALPGNIFFTSGGTESDNLAIYGLTKACIQAGKKHIITTAIEHDAVLKSLADLEKNHGYKITYVKPDKNGLINAQEIIQGITSETVLISICYANNEIGSIAPIAEIGRKILQYRKNNNTPYPYFHTDACQATNYLDLDVEKLHVDLMTVSASKIYGPKGIGLLYVRRGVIIEPIILGGGQENGLRSGTENVAAAAGFAKALSLVRRVKEKETKHTQELANYLWQKIKKVVPEVSLNGPEIGSSRLSNNLNISFKGLENEALLLYLSERGVMCSAGSACSSRTLETSHVLKALDKSDEEARSAVRFSFGRYNTKKEIDYLMKFLPDLVRMLRQMRQVK